MRRVLRGKGVSQGVVAGRALLVEPAALPQAPTWIPAARVEEEVARLTRARQRARAELQEVRARVEHALGASWAGILDAHLLILDDPALVAAAEGRIRGERTTAAWALKEAVEEFVRAFEGAAEGYFRERGGDLADVHRRLQRLLAGAPAPGPAEPGPDEGPTILVAHSLGAADALALSRRGVVGLASDLGGRTSHIAILAQALSVPGVVGLHDVSRRVRTGDPLVLDGELGEVILDPTEQDRESARRQGQARQAREAAREAAGEAAGAAPTATRDGVPVALRANVELPGELDLALRLGAEGIGLYRSEFLFLSHAPELPDEEAHYRAYRSLVERVAPHPAVIRTLDLGGEKYFHDVLAGSDQHPMLGLRAIRLCLKRPDIFLPQLRGLLRAAVHGDLRILIPFVTAAEEVRAVRGLLAQEAAALAGRGIAVRPEVPLGIMVETPAAALTADLLAREADFFALGTNDLAQYTLAVDRNNESVSEMYQPLHPAVLRLMDGVVRAGRVRHLPVSLCGEVAAEVSLVPLLVGLGLREFSVHPRALTAVREAVRAVDAVRAEEGVRDLLAWQAGEAGRAPARRRQGGGGGAGGR